MIKNKSHKLIFALIVGLIFADPPNWDSNGDGVLDNYNDYENNGSITAMVSTDGSSSFGTSGDMIACFVGEEQRGVGLAASVPFGPYAGTYQFQMMIYSNEVGGETLIFQYYSQSTDTIYDLNESLEFEINMTEGTVLSPYILTFEESDDGGGGGSGSGDFAYSGMPDWDSNDDGVLDNYNDYENNGSITAMVSTDGNSSFSASGDMIACFVGEEQRGVGLASSVPFGPYAGTYQFQMMIYSNEVGGETLTFQYYSQSANAVYNLNQSLEFEINMTVGTVLSPYILTFDPGDDIPDPIYGCMDESACNYDSDVTNDDGSCEYADDFYNCDGNCISDSDQDGVCDELEVLGCTDSNGLNYNPDATDDDGSCLLAGCTDLDACNYDFNANTDDGLCEYPEDNYDCDGNCTIDIDCAGVCGGDSYEDECGVCDNIPPNDCTQDCAGDWGGTAEIDNCGICDSDSSNDCVQDCAGEWGGDVVIDECDICGGTDLNDNGFCDPECPDNYTLNPQFPNVNENNVCVPDSFAYNISTVSAGYLFYEVTINGESVDNNDWVGAFNGDVCVGSQIWNTSDGENAYAGNVCSISVMGSDNNSFTEGYMLFGDIPSFKIYDASDNIYYDAYPSENVPWENFGLPIIDLLSTQIQGCTDETACNFDLEAIEDDGSCEYSEDNYDCDGNCIVDIDCAGDCGGNASLDECGECDGDNSTCTGCTDSEALNYDETALIDDGSCIFDFDLPPELFEFNQSTQQAFYFFQIVSIDDIPLDDNDWVGAFNGDICVGSKKWDTSLCGDGICDLPVMGDDNEDYSDGYMEEGQVPVFKIYDYSEQEFYNAVPSNNIEWENLGIFILDYLNVFPDCAGELDGDALVDDCGDCSLPDDFNAGQDDCGVCYGENADQDCAGECFGTSLVDDCGDCSLPDDFNAGQDDCGVCYGENADQDCAGECFGTSLVDDCGDCSLPDDFNAGQDDCGVCYGENADQDCAGECFGTSLVDDCGDCSLPDDFNAGQDDCGVCYGENADQDCAGECFGTSLVDDCGDCSLPDDFNAGQDDCGVCYGENADQDCAGECFGTSLVDDCGDCSLPDDFNAGQDDCGVCYGENADQDCAGECFGTSLVDDCGDCSLPDDFNAGQDDCGVCYGENADQDCAGECFGTSLVDDCGDCSLPDDFNAGQDDCGVCYGENADQDCAGECFGTSLVDDCGDCSLPDDFNAGQDDCGVCYGENADQDCAGECFGTSLVDDCGVCGGDNSTCSGCTDPNALNYDDTATIDDGSCYYTVPVEIPLHAGANLVSFYALPENLELETFVSPLFNSISGLITEGSAVTLLNNQWIGSILSIDPANGYWFVMNQDDNLEFEGYLLDNDFEYSLHAGPNLISFPSEGTYLLEDILPEDLYGIVYGIISEGESAYYLDDNWVGFEYFEGGKGYWFKSYADVSFSFNIESAESAAARNTNYNNKVLQNFEYIQSSEQAFYYFDNVPDASIGDWIIAYNGDVIVGTKRWEGDITDIAVMGYMSDDFDFSRQYCRNGDIPNFVLYQSQTGNKVPLSGSINPWLSNDISYIGALLIDEPEIPNHFGLSSIYPNPFNPTTTIDFYVPSDMEFSLAIFDLQGRLVETIINQEYSSGDYSIQYNASGLSSGIYFIQLKTSTFVDYSKIILLK